MVCLSVCGVWNNPWYTSTQFAFSFPHNSIDWSHPVYFMTGKTTQLLNQLQWNTAFDILCKSSLELHVTILRLKTSVCKLTIFIPICHSFVLRKLCNVLVLNIAKCMNPANYNLLERCSVIDILCCVLKYTRAYYNMPKTSILIFMCY